MLDFQTQGQLEQRLAFFSGNNQVVDNAKPITIEFDLTRLAEGEHVRLDIFGKPVFIRHRSLEDIRAINASYNSSLYPERDDDRLLPYKGEKDTRYIIVEGISGHWCLAAPNSGDFANQGGWFCYGRSSHFDGSGRLQKGPDMNLKVPRNAQMISKTTVQFTNTAGVKALDYVSWFPSQASNVTGRANMKME